MLLRWLTPDRVVLGAGHLVTLRKHFLYHVWLDAEGADEGTSHITCLKVCEADLVLWHALLFASGLLVLRLANWSRRCWEWDSCGHPMLNGFTAGGSCMRVWQL